MADAWYILTHFASGWDVTHSATEQFPLRQMPVAIAGDCIAGSRTVAAEPGGLPLGNPSTATSRAPMGGVCERGHRHDHVWYIPSELSSSIFSSDDLASANKKGVTCWKRPASREQWQTMNPSSGAVPPTVRLLGYCAESANWRVLHV